MGFPFSIGGICSLWRLLLKNPEAGWWGFGVGNFWEGWTSEDKVLRCFFLQLRTRPSLSCRCEVRGRVKWGTGSEIFHGGRIRTTANRQPTSPRWQPRPSLEIFEARPLCRRGAARGDHLQGIFSVILTAEGWETLMGIGPHGVTYPGIMLFTECHGLLLFPLIFHCYRRYCQNPSWQLTCPL